MTTPKAKFAGLALIAALCGGFKLGLTAPAWADSHEAYKTAPTTMSLGKDAYSRGDYAGALREWRSVAKLGGVESADAQFLIAGMYFDGKGLPRDLVTAFQWHRKAAEQGHAKAQGMLGLMYHLGAGVPQDYLQAHMWYNLSASRSPFDETFNAAAKGRDEVAAKMSPAQISEAQKLAREWKRKKCPGPIRIGCPR